MLWDSIQKKEKMCVCSFFFVILHHEFENIMKLGHFSTIAFLLIAFLQGWDHLPTDFDDVLAKAREEFFPRIDELCALIESEF